MITDIIGLRKEQLCTWLKNEAGVTNGMYFNAFEGNLELQQIPEEYVEYLWFLKTSKFSSYMNIGIGNGGSFITEVFLQSAHLKRAVAVDNTSYGIYTNIDLINERIQWLKNNTMVEIDFFNMNSSDYFDIHTEKFDVIFIDGDHTYEGVKTDYEKALPLLNENGYLIFHDINSVYCPGVVNLWAQIKNDKCIEFIKSNKCGIGLWQCP